MQDFARTLIQVLRKKMPKSPVETSREGIIPVRNFSFMTMMKADIIPSQKATKNGS
jgi:hypothetical protein